MDNLTASSAGSSERDLDAGTQLAGVSAETVSEVLSSGELDGRVGVFQSDKEGLGTAVAGQGDRVDGRSGIGTRTGRGDLDGDRASSESGRGLPGRVGHPGERPDSAREKDEGDSRPEVLPEGDMGILGSEMGTGGVGEHCRI